MQWVIFTIIVIIRSFFSIFETSETLFNESFFFFTFYVWQGILTTLSQSNGKYEYDYATVPFLAEVFKVLCIPLFSVIFFTFCVGNLYLNAYFSAFSVEYVSLEGEPEISSSKNDHWLEDCSFISDTFNYIPDPQQCSICYLDVCGYIHIPDNGQFEDCHDWNFVQVILYQIQMSMLYLCISFVGFLFSHKSRYFYFLI